MWSFTNQYSTGKYVRDGKFDSTKASDQVGAMAVLKQLIAEGAVTIGLQANVPPKPTVPPVPVPTGLFVPSDDQAFQLRAAAQQDADKIQHVETNQPVRKLAEVNADWWNVEVMVPDGTTMVGFARKVWLTPQTVMSSFDLDEFAQVCVDVAGRYGTTANLLIALADAETALTNKASPDGLYFGPFAISEADRKPPTTRRTQEWALRDASSQSRRLRSRRGLSSSSRSRRGKTCPTKGCRVRRSFASPAFLAPIFSGDAERYEPGQGRA